MKESTTELLEILGKESSSSPVLSVLDIAESRYLRDSKLNLRKVLESSAHLTPREAALLGMAIATNERHELLIDAMKKRCEDNEATEGEIAEAAACASLLACNNVLYRFRHFMQKEKYQNIPAGVRMQIMSKPETGKEFFELMSLAVSAVNGCELCVQSHEKSLVDMGTTEERIFDSIRLASVLVSATKIL